VTTIDVLAAKGGVDCGAGGHGFAAEALVLGGGEQAVLTSDVVQESFGGWGQGGYYGLKHVVFPRAERRVPVGDGKAVSSIPLPI
jgi:hypothetical protein